ncbi:LuxR C-terminal-related transcriptional regulator [Sciscionella sediminilitoris]|uniref:LuxR C-terminal-related transcriptional regulator n=1 Tax=Sciscionella sediminilitoris TaxID=1445613 RepID=UPI001E627AA6|nr:response regulator transcription factor [Sciscionella sp. SE31]
MAGSANSNPFRVAGSRAGTQPGAQRPHDRGLGVVLIDQTPLFRDGMANLVNHAPGLRWLGATHNVHAAAKLVERFGPDVALIDAGLDPRGQLTKLLVSSSPTLTVVSFVRDPHRAAPYISDATAAGVHGIVLRAAEPTQIVEAIRRAHSERRYLDPALVSLVRGANGRTPSSRQPLSRREHQVLQLIADGLENQAIAKTLFVSVETVRTHVKSILRKLHARDRAHAVAIAFRLAVLSTQPEPPSAPARTAPGTATGLAVPAPARPLRAARA